MQDRLPKFGKIEYYKLKDEFFGDDDVVLFCKEMIECQIDKETSEAINISVCNLGDNILARTGIARDVYSGKVEFIELQVNRAITLKEMVDGLLVDAIKHECVHIATELKYKENQSHNNNFFREAERMNIITSAKRVLNEEQQRSMKLGNSYISRMTNGEVYL